MLFLACSKSIAVVFFQSCRSWPSIRHLKAELLNPHCCGFSEGLSSSIRWGGSWGGVLFKFRVVGVGSLYILYSSLMVFAHGSKHQVLPRNFLLHSLDAIRNYSNHRCPGSQAIFIKQTNKKITKKTWRVGKNVYSWICLSYIIGMKEQNTFTKVWFKTEKARRKPSWLYTGFYSISKIMG